MVNFRGLDSPHPGQHVRMCIYIYMCVEICIHILHTYTYTYIHTHIHPYKYMCVYTCVYIHMYYLFMSACPHMRSRRGTRMDKCIEVNVNLINSFLVYMSEYDLVFLGFFANCLIRVSLVNCKATSKSPPNYSPNRSTNDPQIFTNTSQTRYKLPKSIQQHIQGVISL